MEVRQATESDIEAIVFIHIAAFQGFFLTLLGTSFLKSLYMAFLKREYGILRVAITEQDKVVGFAAGTSLPQSFFSQLRKEQWVSFLLKALPSLLIKPTLVIKKLYFALFYKGDKPATLSDVSLLSSIAVLPDLAGKSVGKLLISDFEAQVKVAGSRALYLTTDKVGNDKVVFFYERVGYQIECEFKQPSGREMLRLIKYLK